MGNTGYAICMFIWDLYMEVRVDIRLAVSLTLANDILSLTKKNKFKREKDSTEDRQPSYFLFILL